MLDFNIKEITDFSQGNMLIFITLFTNIVSLIVIIFIVFKNKYLAALYRRFELTKKAAILEIGVYGLFFLVVSIITGIMQAY